jgi:hypothetical protein
MLCVGLVHYGMVVLDTTGRNPKNLLRPVSQGNLVRVAFTPDGKTIVSTHDGSQHQVMITVANKGSWKTETVELPPGCESIHSFALASDGRHIALGDAKRKVYILRLGPPLGR